MNRRELFSTLICVGVGVVKPKAAALPRAVHAVHPICPNGCGMFLYDTSNPDFLPTVPVERECSICHWRGLVTFFEEV